MKDYFRSEAFVRFDTASRDVYYSSCFRYFIVYILDNGAWSAAVNYSLEEAARYD